jgi:hypothetical protein
VREALHALRSREQGRDRRGRAWIGLRLLHREVVHLHHRVYRWSSRLNHGTLGRDEVESLCQAIRSAISGFGGGVGGLVQIDIKSGQARHAGRPTWCEPKARDNDSKKHVQESESVRAAQPWPWTQGGVRPVRSK